MRLLRNFTKHAEGSVLVEFGDTRVICTASVEERVPAFLKGKGEGWVTAEYGMLPRATHTRSDREAARGKQGGRTQEIQRLIGRSLRAVFDLAALGERSLHIDCDVIQADGGTRTAAITGGFVAAYDACRWLRARGMIDNVPVSDFVAAVSVGLHGGVPVLDLDYVEDSGCDTDMNVVMTGKGGFVEVQGTAEGAPFSAKQMESMLQLAERRHPLAGGGAEARARIVSRRLVLASANAAKLREISMMLDGSSWDVVPQSVLGVDSADEPHATFVENALAKARHAAARTGTPALADDSGLCVESLNGAPGVRSARFAGEAANDQSNNAELLRRLSGVTSAARALHLRSGRAFARPKMQSRSSSMRAGTAKSRKRRAAQADSVMTRCFTSPSLGLTAAELDPAHKNRISHRGLALRALAARLADWI